MRHATESSIPQALAAKVQEFLRHRDSDQPVSIANMIRRTRNAIPDLALSDDDLEQAIAEEIIRTGGNIAFDRREAHRRGPKLH